MWSYFSTPFYLDVVGLDATELGLISLVVGFYDAFTDPLMGYFSDGTATRWGRRRPFILLGFIPLALTYVAKFSTQLSTAAWFYWLAFLLNDSFSTIVNIPYSALISEMAVSYDDSTSITAYRNFMGYVVGMQSSLLLLPLLSLIHVVWM